MVRPTAWGASTILMLSTSHSQRHANNAVPLPACAHLPLRPPVFTHLINTMHESTIRTANNQHCNQPYGMNVCPPAVASLGSLSSGSGPSHSGATSPARSSTSPAVAPPPPAASTASRRLPYTGSVTPSSLRFRTCVGIVYSVHVHACAFDASIAPPGSLAAT